MLHFRSGGYALFENSKAITCALIMLACPKTVCIQKGKPEDDILKKYIWGILYGILLTAFTGYVLLDTFVITRVYQTIPHGTEGTNVVEQDDKGAGSHEPVSEQQNPQLNTTVDSYSDDDISISISEYVTNHTTVYVADVRLSSAEYLKTAFANASYGRNVTAKTSEIAAENHAILAINGDYYGAQEKGYVLRNGVLYRDSVSRDQEDLAIYNDGSFGIFEEHRESLYITYGCALYGHIDSRDRERGPRIRDQAVGNKARTGDSHKRREGEADDGGRNAFVLAHELEADDARLGGIQAGPGQGALHRARQKPEDIGVIGHVELDARSRLVQLQIEIRRLDRIDIRVSYAEHGVV